MLESSKDILNIVAAISIATLVFFLCWALYYVIFSARKTFKLVKRTEKSIEKFESLIDLIKDKISGGSAYLSLLSSLVKKGMDFADYRARKKNSASNKKEK